VCFFKILVLILLCTVTASLAFHFDGVNVPFMSRQHTNVPNRAASPEETLTVKSKANSEKEIPRFLSLVYCPAKCSALEAISLSVLNQEEVNLFLARHHLPARSKSFGRQHFQPANLGFFAAVRKDW